MKKHDDQSQSTASGHALMHRLLLGGARARWLIRKARRAARQGDWSEASTFYGKAAWLTPNNAGLWIQLGHALKEDGNHDAAVEAYRHAMMLRPMEEDAYRHLAFLLADLGRSLEANALLARTLCFQPDDMQIRARLSENQVEISEFLMASAARQIARRLPPQRPITTIGSIIRRGARQAARSGQWEKAEAAYQRLLASFPFNHDVWMQLGHALKAQGKYDLAERSYRHAIMTDVNSADSFAQLGHILKLRNALSSALDAYIIAWQLDSSCQQVYRELKDAGLSEDSIYNLASASSNPRKIHDSPDVVVDFSRENLPPILQVHTDTPDYDFLASRLSSRTYAIYDRLKIA